MKKFWDERYSSAEFAYGEEPNEYFKAQLSKLEPGKILLPGDGEGRNGVYAAKLGWEVESFDISSEGKMKADKFAEEHGLAINYQVGGLEDLSYESNYFDAIALVFTHFNPVIRANYRKKFIELLKPGGNIILESFSTKHLAYSAENPKAGGPKDVNLLTTLKQIEKEFAGLDIIELYQTEAVFNEGAFHLGKGDVVRFLGRKKE